MLSSISSFKTSPLIRYIKTEAECQCLTHLQCYTPSWSHLVATMGSHLYRQRGTIMDNSNKKLRLLPTSHPSPPPQLMAEKARFGLIGDLGDRGFISPYISLFHRSKITDYGSNRRKFHERCHWSEVFV